jgi:hypothetical protein
MRNSDTNDTDRAGLQRDLDEWKTGDEPMTAPQRSYRIEADRRSAIDRRDLRRMI